MTQAFPIELLTPEEMAQADLLAVEAGVSSLDLMERAGREVALAIMARFARRPVAVLCGPGNNGGDGFVAARHLRDRGWPVRVLLHGDPDRLRPDAEAMARAWSGPIEPADPAYLTGAQLIIVALFGAGLSRPIEGEAARLINVVNEGGVPVVAIDLPSGIDGRTGAVCGTAVRADLTVTFLRLKPGHLLMPGRDFCGETVVADIGIPASVLEDIRPSLMRNDPAVWHRALPRFDRAVHKYVRGHGLMMSGGPWRTGAARLAAIAALRIGAGLVTLLSPRDALAVNAAHLTAVMLEAVGSPDELPAVIASRRGTAVGLGPGLEPDQATRDMVVAALGAGCPAVLDAGALTAFEGNPDLLFEAIKAGAGRGVVLTPHEGEFRRLLGSDGPSKWQRAAEAARMSGGTVILKGYDTVIAAPDGRVAINHNATPNLATAGSGDVLCGLVLGLLAQGMAEFEAAAAAVWLHAEAGRQFGPGLIAEDLPGLVPAVLYRIEAL